MKTSLLRLIAILVTSIPLMASAQTNIKGAFDALINNPKARITKSQALQKDPKTKVKTGQCAVYEFVLPSGQMNVIKNILNAIEKDSPMSYSYIGGNAGNNGGKNSLFSGIGGGEAIVIDEPGTTFSYALFLAPVSEDPNGIYRYAYAINYRERNGNIEGKLVVSYATTLKYRQQVAQEIQGGAGIPYNFTNGNITTSSNNENVNGNWFNALMWNVSNMDKGDTKRRIFYATKAYKIISEMDKYQNVTELDKNSAREIFKVLISKKENSDPILNTLLRQCLNGIK